MLFRKGGSLSLSLVSAAGVDLEQSRVGSKLVMLV